MKFNELDIKETIKEAIAQKGFEQMTDIQKEAIPKALAGQDILGQAQTGTGKTAAFAIPIINQIEIENKKVQALILVPTRELALQVAKEINSLTTEGVIKAISVFGGDPIDKQLRELKNNPQIVVATPGRCIDLINRNKLKIKNLKFFALDEVDEMLNMGFIEDVEYISSMMPSERQTLLFSATMPERIKKIANKYLQDPEVIKVKSKSIVADRVDQYYIKAKAKQKNLILKNIIDLNNKDKIIIFTQTKRSADEVSDFLLSYSLMVGKIHGDLPQAARTKTIQKFRDSTIQYLVATDVVARGIDIDNINLVINYELPQDIEYYIHRIGRTARGMDNKGRAITLVTPRAYDKEFRHYERQLKVKIKEQHPPKVEEVIEILKEKYVKQILKTNDVKEKSFYEVAQKLCEVKEAEQIIANLLKQLYPQLSKEENLKLLKQTEETNNKKRTNNRERNKDNYNSKNNGKNKRKANSDNRRSFKDDKSFKKDKQHKENYKSQRNSERSGNFKSKKKQFETTNKFKDKQFSQEIKGEVKKKKKKKRKQKMTR
ncbi:MAG: DEAD/DEAH box helicase [Mycoplasmatales bacterium]